jgi:uncharacterized membrane protein
LESFGNKVYQYLVVPFQSAIPVEHQIIRLLLKAPLDLKEEPNQLLELHYALMFVSLIMPIVVLLAVNVIVMAHTVDLQGFQEGLKVRKAIVSRSVHHVLERNAAGLEVAEAHNKLVQVLMKVLEVLKADSLLADVSLAELAPDD